MTIFDVIAVGSNVIDTYVKTDPDESDLITIKHGKLLQEDLVAYPLGTKIIIKHLEFQIGGGGTNTAVAFSRLGLKTAYLGKIGKDENGLKIFNYLEKEHVNFIGVLGDINGYSVVLDSVGDDRTILTFKGCNNDLAFRELHKEKLKAKAYYLCSMMGKSLKTLEQVAIHAKNNGSLVAFNPSSYLTKQGIRPIEKILRNTDVLIFNDEEAQQLAGFGTDEELAIRLTKTGPSTIVITKGNAGVLVYSKGRTYRAMPPKKLVIHETTGAGDSFGSTFFASIIKGEPISVAIKKAMINAESVIANYGAKNILLTKEQLEKKMLKDKRTVTRREKR